MSFDLQLDEITDTNIRIGIFSPNPWAFNTAFDGMQLSHDSGGIIRSIARDVSNNEYIGTSCSSLDTSKHYYNLTLLGGTSYLYKDGALCDSLTTYNTNGYAGLVVFNEFNESEHAEFSDFQFTNLDATTSTSTTTTIATTTTTLPPTTTTTLPVTTTTLGGYKAGDIAGAVVTGMYLFVGGLTGFAGDLGAMVVLGVFASIIVVSLVSMTEGGRKTIKGLFGVK
jgi:hypothetical protein